MTNWFLATYYHPDAMIIIPTIAIQWHFDRHTDAVESIDFMAGWGLWGVGITVEFGGGMA
jgi:hypothetical protein